MPHTTCTTYGHTYHGSGNTARCLFCGRPFHTDTEEETATRELGTVTSDRRLRLDDAETQLPSGITLDETWLHEWHMSGLQELYAYLRPREAFRQWCEQEGRP